MVTVSPMTLNKEGSSTPHKGKISTSRATLENVKGYPMWNVNTVRKQFEGYNKQEAEKENLPHKLQGMAGHPTDQEYKDTVRKKLLPKPPITTHDITSKNSTFLTDLADMRGRTLINKAHRLDTEEYVKIPEGFYKMQKFCNDHSQ